MGALVRDVPFDASKSSVQCAGAMVCEKEGGCTEDCLTLDIFTPPNRSDELLPVMVFFPGGAFISGCADCEGGLYNGSVMVKTHNVVFVAVNYRLGAFGWLTLADTDVTGNFGLMDQRESLRWIQRNI